MKRLLIALLLAFAMQGCMDLRVNMDLQNDWSGSATFELEMLDQMYQMIKMQVQQSGQDVFLLQDDENAARAALESKLESEGARLTKFENQVTDGMRKIHVALTFKDGKKMIESTGDGLLSLEQDGDSWRLAFMDMETNSAFQGMGQEELEQSLAMMQPMMAGLKMNFEVQVPQIVETNLKKNNRSATFNLSFDDDVADKSGKPAADAFRDLMSPKWIRFKGMK